MATDNTTLHVLVTPHDMLLKFISIYASTIFVINKVNFFSELASSVSFIILFIILLLLIDICSKFSYFYNLCRSPLNFNINLHFVPIFHPRIPQIQTHYLIDSVSFVINRDCFYWSFPFSDHQIIFYGSHCSYVGFNNMYDNIAGPTKVEYLYTN